MKIIQVKKGEILQQKGDLNTKVFRVQRGLLRSYSIDEKGKEHIFMFAPEHWIMADNCPADLPCNLYIDALEDAVLEVAEKRESVQQIDVVPIMKRLETLQNRIIMLMSSPAVDRYEHFVKTYPNIIQRVPQRMIASYLGVTPEALSRVRASLLEK